MRISIILVNWNSWAETQACVNSLTPYFDKEKYGFEVNVIIVDNASTDTSPEHLLKLLESYTPFVHLIRNTENVGFAGGNNAGIAYSLHHHDPDFVWLLNNDTVVDDESLSALVKASIEYPKYKIWGSTIYSMPPSVDLQCAGGFRYNALLSVPRPVLNKKSSMPSGLFKHNHNMDYVSGISMFIQADCFRNHGLMNEEYFLFYEELDLVRQFGGKSILAWCPGSKVYHKGGSSTKSKDPNRGKGSNMAHYYGNLSALKYTRKYYPAFLPVVFIFRLMAKSILFLRYGDWKSFRPLISGYLDFIRGSVKRNFN